MRGLSKLRERGSRCRAALSASSPVHTVVPARNSSSNPVLVGVLFTRGRVPSPGCGGGDWV